MTYIQSVLSDLKKKTLFTYTINVKDCEEFSSFQ